MLRSVVRSHRSLRAVASRAASSAARRRSGLLALAVLRHVPGDLAEPAELSGRVADRGQQHVGPESGPILAHPPAGLVRSPLPLRPAQQRARQVLRPVLGGVERREVPPDDLVRAVALDPLGAYVPGLDPTGRIEQEDGVILHDLDQEGQLVHRR
jgi:hypothetical protein